MKTTLRPMLALLFLACSSPSAGDDLTAIDEPNAPVEGLDAGTSGVFSDAQPLADVRAVPRDVETFQDGSPPAVDAGVTTACKGLALKTSGVLDFDLKRIDIAGKVTVNGKPISGNVPTGTGLEFVENQSGFRTTVNFSSLGPLEYTAALSPGTYDIRFIASKNGCGLDPKTALPCVSGPLKTGVALKTPGVLDLDIPAIRLSGKVTVNGSPMPTASGERGNLSFASQSGDRARSVSFEKTGAASYEAMLIPGVYTLGWEANTSLCESGSPSVPCVSGPLKEQVSVRTSGVLDVDVPSIQVTGKVTLMGKVLPTEKDDRGHLRFSLAGGGAMTTRAFGNSGSVTYAATLLRGQYEVGFFGNPGLCKVGSPTMPCNSGPIGQPVALTAARSLDVDIPAVKISGNVTVRNRAMPAEALDRGALRFTLVGSDGVTTRSFGSSGSAPYSMTLLPGTYAVGWEPNESLCGLSAAVPCNRGVLKDGVVLASNGVLDIDVPSVKVSGKVTVNGSAMQPEMSDRGRLRFALSSGEQALGPSFDRQGAVNYAIALLPGVYAISLETTNLLCVYSKPEIPCVSGPLRSGVDLASDGVLDIDIPAIQVRGTLKQNGQLIASSQRHLGALLFANVGGGSGVSPELSYLSPANYQLTLISGSYVVTHVANPDQCGPDRSPEIPCINQVVSGCP